ncbi:MAG TPA: hypothetical protein VK576_11350 [Thermoleophilia bacterium]|nr:hypothetical protein [Thermoleophilia bacterium]
MLCTLVGKIGEPELEEIKRLEGELDMTILAYSCYQAEAASVDDRQLARIRELEERLGLSLVAVAA